MILPLTFRDVSFEIGGTRLIKNLTCTLEAGPRTMILGANGAGKSLFLRLCHGLLEPSAGRISWHGARGGNPRRDQAMVFQRPVMLRRSAAANIAYALKLKRTPRAEWPGIIDDALGRTGLRRLSLTPARVLSIGEQQKLALSRAWVMEPEVLFLDEPTASLDPAATREVENMINALHEAGTKIIMTTHDLGQARRLADDIIFMHQGRLIERAGAEEFFEHPRTPHAEAFLNGELLP